MNFIASFLNKPFPSIELPRQKLVISFLFGLFVYTFLFVFQPFDIDKVVGSLAVYALGFGFITLSIMLISFFIGPLLFQSFFDADKWNIGKNMVFIFTIITGISILNWLFNTYMNEDITLQHSLLRFILITFAIGIMPVTFLLFFIESKLHQTNTTIAKSVSNQIQNLPVQKNHIPKFILTSENKNEDIELELKQLICIKSEGNYVLVSYKTGDQIAKKMIRNTISNLEKSLEKHDTIYRCHRSYLVNLENVSQVTGNARNFNLLVANLDFTIPVSRSFPKSILNSIA